MAPCYPGIFVGLIYKSLATASLIAFACSLLAWSALLHAVLLVASKRHDRAAFYVCIAAFILVWSAGALLGQAWNID